MKFEISVGGSACPATIRMMAMPLQIDITLFRVMSVVDEVSPGNP